MLLLATLACCVAGTSAQTQANLAAITEVLMSGSPLSPTFIYPDTEDGNAGLCQFVAAQMVMPQAPTPPMQVAAQNPAIYSFLGGPSTAAYTGLGNITNPVLVIAGSQDQILSVQDDYLIVNTIPEASFLQYADAGHAAILQHGATNGVVISAFLDA